ncbi:MAG: fumarylacetoacetate hydrolase family protein, partial [Phycisphaerales bacterium]|nr:fumarylacetoacetate hydrolase family protein [Phycisphaerales bacterium]
PRQLLEELNKAVALATGSPAAGLVNTGVRIGIKQILAPLLPTNILCVGRNYVGPNVRASVRDEPLEVFMKPTTAVQGPDRPIRLPHIEDGTDPEVDCEGELAVVIGTEVRNATPEEAMSSVFGFTIANDVTARRYQTPTGPPQYMRGKGFDTFCPIGPVIIPASELPSVGDLTIRTTINDHVVREGEAGDMLRPIPVILSELSRNYTLSRGTVVLTGAPPLLNDLDGPHRLAPGDRVTIDVEGIGRLSNSIVASDDR